MFLSLLCLPLSQCVQGDLSYSCPLQLFLCPQSSKISPPKCLSVNLFFIPLPCLLLYYQLSVFEYHLIFPYKDLSMSIIAVWKSPCDHFRIYVIAESGSDYFLHDENVCLRNCMRACMQAYMCVYMCVCIQVCVYVNMYVHKDMCTLPLCLVCFFVFCWKTGMISDVLDPSNSGILLYCEIFMLIWQGAGLCWMFALAVGGRHSNYSNVLVFCLLSWLWDLLSTLSQMESVSCSLLSVIHCCCTQELLMWWRSVCAGDSMRLRLNLAFQSDWGPRLFSL